VSAAALTRLPKIPPSGEPVRRPGRNDWMLLGAIVALGVLVRFPTIGEQSFWYDEAITHGIVAGGLGHVISTVPRTESTPPLYYLLVWLWSRLFGAGEAGLRSFSALCGTLTIPLVWAAGRRLAGERVALIAALLTAVNPLLFWYSQEARSYALMTVLSAASLLALLRALERPDQRRLLAFGVISAFALCAHYFAAFAVVPEVAWLLVSLRRSGLLDARRVLAAVAPIAAMAVALAPLAVHQNDGRASYIAESEGSLAYRLVQLIKQDVVAFDEPEKYLLSAIACGLVGVAFVLLIRRSSREQRRSALLALVIGFGGILLAVLVALLVTDYVDTRNLLPTWPAIALVVAMGFGAARAGRVGAVALAGLVALSLACVVGVVVDPLFQRQNWGGAASAMGPATETRAIVAGNQAYASLLPYLSHLSVFPASGTAVREIDLIALIRPVPGGHAERPPPRPVAPATLPGFHLVQRRETESYTVLRFRASAPVPVSSAALIGLAPYLFPQTVMLQRP